MPPVAPKNQTPFDDEILLLDIIKFFKAHFIFVVMSGILGGILGGLYGKLSDPKYVGFFVISTATVADKFVADPVRTLNELQTKSYYSKENFLACNPTFYVDHDNDYNISDLFKVTIIKNSNLIKLEMIHSNKETIRACLEGILSHMRSSEKPIAENLIELKKSELNIAESRLKILQQFSEQIRGKVIKDSKSNDDQHFLPEQIYFFLEYNNSLQIKVLLDQVNTLRRELSSSQTKVTENILPVTFTRKTFPAPKSGFLLGLFLGGVLGLFISLYRNMKIN